MARYIYVVDCPKCGKPVEAQPRQLHNADGSSEWHDMVRCACGYYAADFCCAPATRAAKPAPKAQPVAPFAADIEAGWQRWQKESR